MQIALKRSLQTMSLPILLLHEGSIGPDMKRIGSVLVVLEINMIV